MVATPMHKLCMHINDVYYGKSEMLSYVHVKPTSMLTRLFIFTIGHYPSFRECFGYMWMEIRYNFTNTKRFRHPIMVCTFWHENLRRCSTIELFPSSGSHKIHDHFQANLSGQRSYL